jgi:hypothetical protein
MALVRYKDTTIRRVLLGEGLGDALFSIAAEDVGESPITEIDEGETVYFRVSLDLSNGSWKAGDFVDVRVDTPSGPEFAAGYPGEVQAERADFVLGYFDSMKLAADATAGVTCPENGVFRFTYPAQEVVFSRQAINDPGEQGDKLCVMRLSSPSQGSVDTPLAEVDVRDTYVSPATNGWEISGAIDGDGVQTVYVPIDSAVGTVVGTISATGGTISSIDLDDDADGFFEMDGADLKCVAPPDFQGPDEVYSSVTAPWGIPWYFVTVTVSFTSGSPVQQVVRICPHFAKIEPTGGGAVTPQLITDFGTWRSTAGSGSSDKHLKIPDTVTGVWALGGNSSTYMRGSNRTYSGHPYIFVCKDKAPNLDEGTNVVVFNMTFRAGAQLPGAPLEDRDSFQLRPTNGKVIRDIWFKNCSFPYSVDEMLSVIPASYPFARNIRFTLCWFADALRDAGHPEGNHDYGALVYRHNMNQVFDLNYFGSNTQRNPLFSLNVGGLAQNNLIIAHGTSGGGGGVQFQDPRSGMTGTNQPGSIISRGNLFRTSSKKRTHTLHQTGSYVNFYIEPDDSDYANHVIQYSGGFAFVADAINAANGASALTGSSAAAFKDWPGFTTDMDDALWPTVTEQNRSDLFDYIVANAGPHVLDANGNIIPGTSNMCQADYDSMSYMLTHGAPRELGGPDSTTYTSVEDLYGTAWNGVGGSTGNAAYGTVI